MKKQHHRSFGALFGSAGPLPVHFQCIKYSIAIFYCITTVQYTCVLYNRRMVDVYEDDSKGGRRIWEVSEGLLLGKMR
jgi:hypothetical protein